jgi:hypothetical protein
VKRVFRYLKGTSDFALCYHGNLIESQRTLSIRGYLDSDWAGDIDNRRSTSGYLFMMNGGTMSWMSKQQAVVTLSTIKVEYRAVTHA